MDTISNNTDFVPSLERLKEMSQPSLRDIYRDLLIHDRETGIISVDARARLYDAMELDDAIRDYYRSHISKFIEKNLSNTGGDYFLAYDNAQKNWTEMSDDSRLAFLKDHIQRLAESFGFDGAPTLSVRDLGQNAGGAYISIIDPPFGHITIAQSCWDEAVFNYIIYIVNHEFAHSVSYTNCLRIPSERRKKLSDNEQKLLPKLEPNNPIFSYYAGNRLNVSDQDEFSFYFTNVANNKAYTNQPEEKQAQFLGYALRDVMVTIMMFVGWQRDRDAFIKDVYDLSQVKENENLLFFILPEVLENGTPGMHKFIANTFVEMNTLRASIHENTEGNAMKDTAKLIGMMAYLCLFKNLKDCAKDTNSIEQERFVADMVIQVERFVLALEEFDRRSQNNDLMITMVETIEQIDKENLDSAIGLDDEGYKISVLKYDRSGLPSLWPKAKKYNHSYLENFKTNQVISLVPEEDAPGL